ncbi:alpha/beta hydrolase family protein [Mariniflexile sp.]|uniref:alpha/beta hydrolase family protein n=1 Tax=Mariniflexile sp. TaxID=1979402 RepID=UPI003563908B
MLVHNDIVINGDHHKPIVIDVTYMENSSNLPIIIFCHGYKGFKDWGAWNVMADQFAKAGFCFIKFNFSHNGGTVSQPIDFPNLEAFGNNNYTKELDDLQSVLDWIESNSKLKNIANPDRISLIGHSRGGGIALIKAEEDERIKEVISLASVCDFGSRMTALGDLENWKQTGVIHVLNGRTKQKMPHYYQFYEDFKANEKRLTIKRAVSNLNKPHLIIHGNQDDSVLLNEAEQLHEWNPKSDFQIIDEANHVFGTSHPWEKDYLPSHLNEVVKKSIKFLKK